MHLTLVPFIASAGELKTKPTQHSVQKLREIGISPDVLLCRADRPIPEEERAKISLFSNVPMNAVISVWDADSIYKVPRMLHKQGADEIVCFTLGLVRGRRTCRHGTGWSLRWSIPSTRSGSAWSASTSTCPTRTSR